MIEQKVFTKIARENLKTQIEDLIRKHNAEMADFKTAYLRLENSTTEKDKSIRDINYRFHNEQAKTRDLEQKMQNLHKEKLDLERNLMSEIQSLNQSLNEQQGTFSQMRQQEISNLNNAITQLNTQKQKKEVTYIMNIKH